MWPAVFCSDGNTTDALSAAHTTPAPPMPPIRSSSDFVRLRIGPPSGDTSAHVAVRVPLLVAPRPARRTRSTCRPATTPASVSSPLRSTMRRGSPPARRDHVEVRLPLVGDERRRLPGEGQPLAVGREGEVAHVQRAPRELDRGLRGHVDRPQADPRVHLGRRPRVVLVLLLLLALLALGLAREVADRLAVGRPLEVRHVPTGRRQRLGSPAVGPDEPRLSLALVVLLLDPRPRPLGDERDPLPVGRPPRASRRRRGRW